MSDLLTPGRLGIAHLVLSLLVVVFDIIVAGRITRLRDAPRLLGALSAIAGLLIAPALFVTLASSSLLSGRALHAVAWVWPATSILIAAQASYAVWIGRAAPQYGIPIALYDLLLAIIYSTRYAIFLGAAPSEPLLALVGAQMDALATVHPLAIGLPLYLHVPMVAPVHGTGRRLGALLRGTLAALAVAWAALIVVAFPKATRAVRSYARYAGERLQERPRGDFLIGLKIFPTLSDGPPPLGLKSDLALADSLGVAAISVYVAPDGASRRALDSLAHSLDEQRRGGKRLIVALDFTPTQWARPDAAAEPYLRARRGDVERIARRLRPDYLVPVVDPNGTASRALGERPPHVWEAYLRDAAAAAHRIDPRIGVIAHIGGYTASDSALYAWAAAAGSPVDGVAVSLYPWYDGASVLDARMRTADRWMRASRSRKQHW
ncbi:MAG: hypothetical protein M3336_17660, partial [Chloroflexota bacterium]|nr:hypothetical protein [Chloroflexota bacterium]